MHWYIGFSWLDYTLHSLRLRLYYLLTVVSKIPHLSIHSSERRGNWILNTLKYLGLWLDGKLSCCEHTRKVSEKTDWKSSSLRSLKKKEELAIKYRYISFLTSNKMLATYNNKWFRWEDSVEGSAGVCQCLLHCVKRDNLCNTAYITLGFIIEERAAVYKAINKVHIRRQEKEARQKIRCS